MNWGIRIAILYIGFVILILTLVFTSMNNKEDLVSPDYYAQELKYQERIDASRNAVQLDSSVHISVQGKAVMIGVPKAWLGESLHGQVYFFRPSDASKDLSVSLFPDASGQQRIVDARLVRGHYIVQCSWQYQGKTYFEEHPVFIP